MDVLAVLLRSLDAPECDPIQHEEQRELIRKSQAGCVESRNRLASSMMRYVVKIAKGYSKKSDQLLLEYIQEGAIGVMVAIRKFDLNRDVTFSTYATYAIHSQIRRTIGDQEIVRLPPKAIKKHADRAKAIRSIEDIRFGEDREQTFDLEDFESGLPGDEISHFEQTNVNLEHLQAGIDALPIRSRVVIMLRKEGMTLEQIGEVIGVTRERVRQIEKKGRRKLARLLAHLEPTL